MLAVPVLLALLCLLPGLPLAVLLARTRPERTPFSHVVTEGVVLGLAWYLLVGIVLAHAGGLTRAGVMAPTLVVAAVATGLNLRRRAWPGVVNNARGSALTLYVFGAFVVAALVRSRPAYFLYQIGDFGEYVNRGNVLADGGDFSQWFTHGFSVLLALSHLALGEERTVDVMPFLGLAVMAVAIALASRLGAGNWGKAVVATVFAIGVVPVWFSQFPASETLYALLLLAMVLFAVTAARTGHHPTAAAGGVLAFLLMLTRGNALLVVPLLLGAVLLAAFLVQGRALASFATFTVASMAGLFAGFVYNSRYSYPYFVEFQMPQFFPEAVWRRFDDLGGLRAAVPKGLVFAAAVALVLWAAASLHRRFGPDNQAGWLRAARAGLLPAIVVVGALATAWPLDAGGLRDALERYDVVVYVLAAVGLAWATARFAGFAATGSGLAGGSRLAALPDAHRLGLVLVVGVATAFALLHAYRFPEPRYAPYYLYWDRYLWSEFFPALVVLGGVGVSAFELGWQRLGRHAARRAVAGGVAAAVAVVAVWSLWSAGELSRRHRFMGDAYADLAQVAELVGDLPVVYAGVERADVPPAIYHSNTFRLFALPLAQTFGRPVLNIHLHPYAHDPRPTLEEVRRIVADAGYQRAALLEVVDPGGRSTDGLRTLGTVDVEIPMLDRPVFGEPDDWRMVHVRLAVREVVL